MHPAGNVNGLSTEASVPSEEVMSVLRELFKQEDLGEATSTAEIIAELLGHSEDEVGVLLAEAQGGGLVR
jgi:hypothetical protein